MNLRDKETWLERHGVMSTSIDAGMNRINWVPTFDGYQWSRFADTYADALDVLFNAVKSELYYRINNPDKETFYGSR